MIRIALLLSVLLAGLSGSAQDVYKTPSGQKYHLESCRMVKNVSQKLSVEEATALGLQPCKIGNPAVVPIKQNTGNNAKGQDQTVQCKGYTKSGTRCKHMTSIGNGYCFNTSRNSSFSQPNVPSSIGLAPA